jgi:nitrous oxidase accessory protein NosD
MNARTLKAVTFALTFCAAASAAQAQSRTWVSGVGNDANPCSRTAPCKTFAGAFSKTSAGGEINVLDPGAFGTVTITKSISIEADDNFAGILSAGLNGIIINAAATDRVVIRGLTIEGSTSGLNGIRLIAGGTVEIEDCTINNFSQKGIDIEPTAAGTTNVFIKNTIVRNNILNAATGGGILLKPAVGGTIKAYLENVSMDHNVFGIQALGGTKVTIRNSSASNNTNSGFQASGGAVQMMLDECIAANNANGIRVDGSTAILRFSNTTITQNASGVNVTNAGQAISFQNNRIAGNTNDILNPGTLSTTNEQ